MAGESLFYYVTYKYVLLKDARLGVLYYLLVFLCLIFTVIEIFIKKGYMEFDTHPQGTIKLILSDDFANESLVESDLPYCGSGVNCIFLDPWDLNWPTESHAVTITSYGKDRILLRNNRSDGLLNKYELNEEKIYFTKGPEYVTIKVDHAVVASQFTDSNGRETLAASHRQLRGFLMDSSGKKVREISAPNLGKPDRVTVGELLQAAGVESLEEESDAINAKGRSLRERGLILRVIIFYQNWFSCWFVPGDVEYRYYVHRVPFVDYSSKQVEPVLSKEDILSKVGMHNAEWRLVQKRYSIRVEFDQAGSLGQFSLPTLLLKLVSGMGLLTLTTTIVDTLALFILPDRSKYRHWVYEESEDLKHTITKGKSD